MFPQVLISCYPRVRVAVRQMLASYHRRNANELMMLLASHAAQFGMAVRIPFQVDVQLVKAGLMIFIGIC